MTDENSNNTEVQNPSWYIDEGVPGIGVRPSWLPDKYKSVADLAKSNAELEKRLGSVPEKYDFSKSKFLDPTFKEFQDLQNFAKEKRVPAEVMDKFIQSVDKYIEDFKSDYSEELKILGPDAKERIGVLDNWAKANLSKDSYEGLRTSLNSASSIKALEELRGKFMSNVAQVPGNTGSIPSSTSLEDMKIELQNNLEKYKSDETYRKDFSRRIEIAAKNTPGFVDKVGS